MSARKLRGVEPQAIKKSRFKALFWGDAFTGKTTCAMGFPKPYYIECEGRSDNANYIRLLQESGGCFFRTQSFQELFDEIRTLATVKHDYLTVVIDPITYIYSNLIKECGKSGTAMGRHYVIAYDKMKEFLDFILYKLDMNVIITAHAKKNYDTDENYIGDTYDAYKKLHYAFDIEIQTERKGDTIVGVVKKECLGIIKANTVINNFSYKSLEKYYGTEFMTQECVPLETKAKLSVVEKTPGPIASNESIDEIKDIVAFLSINWEEASRMVSAAAGKEININQSNIEGLFQKQVDFILNVFRGAVSVATSEVSNDE